MINIKQIFIIFLFFIGNNLSAQKTEKYLNFYFNECDQDTAIFYSLSWKTDSGYREEVYYIYIKSLYSEGLYSDIELKNNNGEYKSFYGNKKLKTIGNYKQDKKDGIWLTYHYNGMLADSTYYLFGKQIGTSLHYYPNGFLKDSFFFNEDGSGVEVNWYDNGAVMSAGLYTKNKIKHGKWIYYHKNGIKSCAEKYDNGNLIYRKNFSEDDILLEDTTELNKQAIFPGGDKALSKYLYRNLYFPYNYEVKNASKLTMYLSITVNDEGRVIDIYPIIPVESNVDRMAINAIKNFPIFKPAVYKNHAIQSVCGLPINFLNSN